jgi:hypothetical protein
VPANPLLDRLRADPANLLMRAGTVPDPWQATLLRSRATRTLVLTSRQTGKSTTGAALALKSALLRPPALVLILSPTLRQSKETFLKVIGLFNALGKPVPVVSRTALTLELANGSRVLALPGDEEGVRGFSAAQLVILDEAARVRDSLYRAVRPMLAVSGGRLVLMSTPFGERGFFHEAWTGDGAWERVRITAGQCPRISREFLADERKALGERWYRQEYECSFEEAADSVFGTEDVLAAMTGEVQPLFVGGRVDVGEVRGRT